MGHGRAHSISRILQHHLSTIFASHYHHQPNPPTEPSNHNSMSSCHVKAFSNMRIDLLYSIVVTFATSHWLRSPLNFWASVNTVARKEGRLHSQSTRKKRSRKNPDQNTVKAQIMQNILRITYITPPTQTPEWTSLNHKSMKISYAKLVMAQQSMTSHQDISCENCAAKSIQSHNDFST